MSQLKDALPGLEAIDSSLSVLESNAGSFLSEISAASERVNALWQSHFRVTGALPSVACDLSNGLRKAVYILLRKWFDFQVTFRSDRLADNFSLPDLERIFLEELQRALPEVGATAAKIALILIPVGDAAQARPLGWNCIAVELRVFDIHAKTVLLITTGVMPFAGGIGVHLKRISVPILAGSLILPLAAEISLLAKIAQEIDTRLAQEMPLHLPNPLAAGQGDVSFLFENVARWGIGFFARLRPPGGNQDRLPRLSFWHNDAYAAIDVLDHVWDWYTEREATNFANAFAAAIRDIDGHYFEVDSVKAVPVPRLCFFYGAVLHLVFSYEIVLKSFSCKHTIRVQKIYFEVRRHNDEEIHPAIRIGIHYRRQEGGTIDSKPRGAPSPLCGAEQDVLKRRFERLGFPDHLLFDVPIEGVTRIYHGGWPITPSADRTSYEFLG